MLFGVFFTLRCHFELELELGTFAKQVFSLLRKGFMWLQRSSKPEANDVMNKTHTTASSV